MTCECSTCSGFHDGYTETVSDEQGVVATWDAKDCNCYCHSEPHEDQCEGGYVE